MRKVAGYDVRSRKALRPLTRRDRHPKLRGIREVAAETFEPRPSRLLPTRPYPRNDYVQGETEVQAAEAAMMAEEIGRRTAQAPARSSGSQQAEFSAIPWTVSGPFSLNPLPRYAARQDLDWRR